MRHAIMATVLSAACLAAIPASAREEIPAETRLRGYSAVLSACDSPDVLDSIQSRFNANERRYWNSNAEIIAFEKVRQAAFRPHGLDLIPRRYCAATVVLNNRRKTILRYSIIEGGAFAGLANGIQFCVAGYDRNRTAAPGCARLDR
jgi:hypothetical protein